MVIIYHQNNRVTKIVTAQNGAITYDVDGRIAQILVTIAKQFPNETIAWCHQPLERTLSIDAIPTLFHHNKLMISFSTNSSNILGNRIGYIEESPFINVNKKVRYPTWLMNSDVGVIHASLLNVVSGKIKLDFDFDYFLSSFAKIAMPLGLFCYSEPSLLLNKNVQPFSQTTNLFVLFRFVKQHYKTRWIFLLFLNLLIYEKRFSLLPLLNSLFFKTRSKTKIELDRIVVKPTLRVIDQKTIDVVIPTIGRKKYLYDVLRDLAKQTHLPKNVIIVEQNPQEGSHSELDYLENEKWPFVIKHTFTQQAGACNARNLALSQVESEWVFLNDDDNRFSSDLIVNVFKSISIYGVNAISTSYLQLNEIKTNLLVNQSSIFGSGNSIIHSSLLNKVTFNKGFEFGYGEDSDFGMQLRNEGNDIIYLPHPEILHLKAPIGGFRTKPILEWYDDLIQPKPSPTVMLYKILHLTNQQINGYKTILLFKYYKHQKFRNPYSYFIYFQKQWKQSVFWANRLKSRS